MLTRVVCFVLGHRWTREVLPDADSHDGVLLRCRRCARTRDVPDRAYWGAYGAGA